MVSLHKVTVVSMLVLGLATCLPAEEKKAAPAIKAVELAFNAASFKKLAAKASIKKPLAIEDAKTAADYFSADELKVIAKQFDFQGQKLLVFVWRGSGGDRLTYAVMKSYPVQIRFQYQRGRTKDLRQHLKLFALRKNVTFSGPK